MPESLQPFELRQEAILERLGLKAQWESRVKALYDSHVLEILPETERLGFVDIEGHECPLPSYEEIKAMITPENIELLEAKISQGFTRLHLVPLAAPLDTLIAKYKALLLQKHQEGKLLSTKGDQLPLNPDNPLYVWDQYLGADTKDNPEEGIVYFPQSLDRNHQGQTKKQLIESGLSWSIELIEDLPDLPAEGAGEELSGRQQLEANRTSKEYLQALQNDPQYRGERGLSIEGWLIYAISMLEEQNIQIDDWRGQGKGCFNFGSYFPADSLVSYCVFYRDYSLAILGGNSPDHRNSSYGSRSSVKINA